MPKSSRSMEPNYELLKAILSFKGHDGAASAGSWRARSYAQVVEELRRRLAREVRQALWGRLNEQQRSRLKVAAQPRLAADDPSQPEELRSQAEADGARALHFSSRVEHHMPWHIIMAVDCSGSMMDSVIYSAVMAGIFKGLPALRVSLVAFDTAVVDLTEQVDDPTELLMSVQLGRRHRHRRRAWLLRDAGAEPDPHDSSCW